MLSSKPSRSGSFKRSRDISDSAVVSSPPCKKHTNDDTQNLLLRDQSRSPLKQFNLDNLTPLATPTKAPNPQSFTFGEANTPRSKSPSLENHFSDLKLWVPGKVSNVTNKFKITTFTHPIFTTPEIVERILRFVDAQSIIPREKPRHRRKPQSLSHALVICEGDEEKAQKLWTESTKSDIRNAVTKDAALHNCLSVNKLWHDIALSIVTENLYFTDSKKVRKLATSPSRSRTMFSKPSAFVLHKLSKLTQDDLNAVAPIVSSERLKWIELYICPKILPPVPIFQQSRNVEKLVLPGNRYVDDEFLMKIAPHLTKLKVLDLRACDKVSDGGVLSITTNCPLLEVCNLGRHRNGEAITSVSLIALARNTRVDTVGAAGCHITDAGIWELAMHRGPRIKRLSLNNCKLLTNNSVPTLLALKYFPQLSVLEIRDVKHLTNVQPIVAYVRAKRARGIPVLVEGGERIDLLMKEVEFRMEQEHSARVLAAFTEWVNDEELQ
ncbi:LANO_0E09582g1_1 [Lachancea nothofagi CBS 11611]|uniref:LANO_0E09582g1_1 n=1 Tax=Lachancea nothofagi CBS 11611 TaxID=1266666 RepID=A0A1G4JVZ0_9SACH|nr:LANO_0E09582g1_1 [Lachancea nothofagi CBS 11611]